MKKRLLLADDSITIQKVIQITFSHDDYVMTVVDNGDAALEKARAEHPHLILADVFMPGKNGYELCAAVKQDPVLAGTPVLLLTGTFEPFDEVKAKSSGADKWIAKPFESQALINCVEELLSKASVAQPSVPPVQAQAVTPPPAVPSLPEMPVALPSAEEFSLPEDDLWGAEFLSEEQPAPVTFPEPEPVAASQVEDLWGERDILPTSATESAPVSDDLWESFADESTLNAPLVSATNEPAQDLWGEGDDLLTSFESTPLVEESTVELAVTAPESLPFGDVEILEEVELPPVSAASAAAPGEALHFDEAPVFEVETHPEPDVFSGIELVEEPVGLTFEEPEPAPLPSPPEMPLPLPTMASAVPPVSASAEAQVAALSEDEIERIVAKVAGAVIERLAGTLLEKIAWEVVPDMAEVLLKEEIAKLKAEVQA